jgi:rubredoxin
MKQCIKCLLFKPFEELVTDKRKTDGKRNLCKKCQYAYIKSRGYNFTKTVRKYQKNASQRYGISVTSIRKYGVKKALFIFDRDNRKCRVCGTENNLHIHHLDHTGERISPNNEPENLILVCLSCHGKYHADVRWGNRKEGSILLTNNN